MNWYYVADGKQAGPVDDAQLAGLVHVGKILPETLVWRDGMADWQPYGQVRPQATTAAVPPVVTTLDGNEAVCIECGRIFNKNDMIRHGEAWVCAACKPVFLQKLREGARVSTGQLNYAGFWLRFAAVFADGILLWAVNFVIGLVGGLSFGQATGAEPTGIIVLQVVLFVIQIAIGLSYEVIMIGKYGATLGKMACRIKVVTADGDRVSYGRALGRYFAKMLSGMICAIGYIMAGFDEEKRALHDRICNTRVVYR
jgi:uncharacterized RDD family membrane protein YckC